MLCSPAVKALQRVYQYQNSLPQTGGCAHALGRTAESVRECAINELADLFDADAERTSLHCTPQHLALSLLDVLEIGEGGRDEVVLSLYDDPRWSGAIAAKCASIGVNVRWLTDYTAQTVSRVLSSRVGLVALQLLSPLGGSVSEALLDALRFARGAEVPVLLDATYGAAATSIQLDKLHADAVVIGGAAIRAHLGAAVAFWSKRGWERVGQLVGSKADSCASGDVASTAAVAALAASMTQVIRRTGSCRLHEANQRLAALLHHALFSVLRRAAHVQACGIDVTNLSARPHQLPSFAVSCSIPGATRTIARRIYEWDAHLATSIRLTIAKQFRAGRGKRKVFRDELLCVEFTALLHSESDVNRFMECFANFVDAAADTSGS